MYSFIDLEKLLDSKLTIHLDDTIIFRGTHEPLTHQYQVGTYDIHSTKELTQEALKLIGIIIEYNGNLQPYWMRLINHQDVGAGEIPQIYQEATSVAVWLVRAPRIVDELELIQAMFEEALTYKLNKDTIMVFYLPTEEIGPEQFVDQLAMEAMKQVRIIEGSWVEDIKFINQSYDHAILLDQITPKETHVMRYKDALIEQVVAGMPVEKRNLLFENYLKVYPIHGLNSELIETMHSFFKHNLNITDTANELYLHRNTLIYRLNKIAQLSNLDIRYFEDAFKMKILLLLKSSHK